MSYTSSLKGARKLQGLALCLAIGVMLLPLSSHADSNAQASTRAGQSYRVPAGPLSQVLNQFAAQAGIALSFDAGQIGDLASPGLNGHYTVKQGFDQLLSGTGQTAQRQSNGDYVIKALAQNTLEAVTVTGGTGSSARAVSTERTRAYTPEEISSTTKLRLSPRETPQIVNVITHQMAEDFGAQDMEDILNMAPGVSVGHTDDDRRSYTARGYAMAVQYDGLPSNSGIDGADRKSVV